MKLKEELVEIYYNADMKNPIMDDMTYLDTLIMDSLSVFGEEPLAYLIYRASQNL